MELKDLNKELEKKIQETKVEAASSLVERFQVPEDSKCISDIDEFCDALTKSVLKKVEALNEGKFESAEDEQRIIGTCAGLISLIDQYKNVRLSVEFSRRMKFETCPKTSSSDSEKSKE